MPLRVRAVEAADLAKERRKRLVFEKFVRDELEFLREQARHTNAALDLLLKAMALEDRDDDSED